MKINIKKLDLWKDSQLGIFLLVLRKLLIFTAQLLPMLRLEIVMLSFLCNPSSFNIFFCDLLFIFFFLAKLYWSSESKPIRHKISEATPGMLTTYLGRNQAGAVQRCNYFILFLLIDI